LPLLLALSLLSMGGGMFGFPKDCSGAFCGGPFPLNPEPELLDGAWCIGLCIALGIALGIALDGAMECGAADWSGAIDCAEDGGAALGWGLEHILQLAAITELTKVH